MKHGVHDSICNLILLAKYIYHMLDIYRSLFTQQYIDGMAVTIEATLGWTSGECVLVGGWLTTWFQCKSHASSFLWTKFTNEFRFSHEIYLLTLHQIKIILQLIQTLALTNTRTFAWGQHWNRRFYLRIHALQTHGTGSFPTWQMNFQHGVHFDSATKNLYRATVIKAHNTWDITYYIWL